MSAEKKQGRRLSAQEWFLTNYDNHPTFFVRKRDGKVLTLVSELLNDYKAYLKTPLTKKAAGSRA
jgi:hypothetical protein